MKKLVSLLLALSLVLALTACGQKDTPPDTTNPDDMPFIDLLKSSFNHDLQRPQNEMALRNSLSELWIQIYAKAEPLFSSDNASWMTNRDVQFKAILDYIRANYAAAAKPPIFAMT